MRRYRLKCPLSSYSTNNAMQYTKIIQRKIGSFMDLIHILDARRRRRRRHILGGRRRHRRYTLGARPRH
jgi:hypothetical protein